MAMRYHPDRNTSETAEAQFKRVTQAYQLIKDEKSRQQVRDILDLYSFLGRDSPTHKASPPTPVYGSKPIPAARPRPQVRQFSAVNLRATLAEVMLEVRIAMRLERLPLKFIVFFAALLSFHAFLEFEATALKILGVSILQAAVCALAADMVLQMSLRYHRYTLRRIVDRFVAYSVLLSIAGLIYGNLNFGQAYLESVRISPGLVRAGSVMLLMLAGYAWLIFSFLFDKHSPIWEGFLVSFGVGVAAYFSLLFIY